jgi:hypothetical protein
MNETNFGEMYSSEAVKLIESTFNKKLNENELEQLRKFIKFSDNSLETKTVNFVNTYTKNTIKDKKLLSIVNYILEKKSLITLIFSSCKLFVVALRI